MSATGWIFLGVIWAVAAIACGISYLAKRREEKKHNGGRA